MVAGDKQFIGAQLGRAVEIDGINGLVGRERDNFFDLLINTRVDNVFRSDHIGFDAFDRIVLGGRNLFERRGMYHDIDARKRPIQALAVTNVTNKETQ